MTEEEIVEFLTKNIDYFDTNNLVTWFLRETVSATEVVTMKENRIPLPECIRKCAGLRNGNSFKIQCKKNGEIVLRKI
ncbi:hypothetical protein GMD01_10060 [[Ruminococcus] torques]|uniref:hypothetical protein n=1 Tax=[Ruminococcus] torques TaxID=33039 RepID=UPI0012BCE105|nr:hypothetical protein [[Ruminococcus] torques]MTQ74079.1 hypothetical protein [[Ruminococcus] torques]MTQ78387.1 hypothetical protein [[Ruminococcus] torques]MTQ84708.1 hypothetical protein [[Ruminococcus] torques]MTR59125.1 hypothetical protein [[Ruminococcus] torques]MTS75649.1 hypothetical protein [[Ruminococcus] torques]